MVTQDKTLSKEETEKLLKTGIQFGHKKSRRHPSMIPYLYGKRNNMYIIDIEKTEEMLKKTLVFIDKLIKEGKEILFIGTKPNIRDYLRKVCDEKKFLYVNDRWIGGSLTNFSTIKKRLKQFNDLEAKKNSSDFKELPKRERRQIEKSIEKLDNTWRGLKSMSRLPHAIFLLDVPNHYLAIEEAKKKGLAVIAISDADADISQVDYPIPANDDALPAVKYILDKVVSAIEDTKKTKKESEKK